MTQELEEEVAQLEMKLAEAKHLVYSFDDRITRLFEENKKMVGEMNGLRDNRDYYIKLYEDHKAALEFMSEGLAEKQRCEGCKLSIHYRSKVAGISFCKGDTPEQPCSKTIAEYYLAKK